MNNTSILKRRMKMDNIILFKTNDGYTSYCFNANDANEERKNQLEFNNLNDKEKSKLIQKITNESKNRLGFEGNLNNEKIYEIVKDIELQYHNVLINETNYNITIIN